MVLSYKIMCYRDSFEMDKLIKLHLVDDNFFYRF